MEIAKSSFELVEPAEVVGSFFEQAYNRRNWEYVKTCVAESYVEHSPNGAQSADECVAIVQAACRVFPDLHVEIADLITQSDRVAARVCFSGTHRGEFFGKNASGSTISFEAMEFFRVRDGLITESWGSWPIHDILMQIDPEPG